MRAELLTVQATKPNDQGPYGLRRSASSDHHEERETLCLNGVEEKVKDVLARDQSSSMLIQ